MNLRRSTWMLLAVLAACDAREPGPTPAAPAATEPEVWFREASTQVGLRFHHQSGLDGSFFFPEHMGSGGALFDSDDDGDLDVYLVMSGFHQPGRPSPPNRLYRQEADGRFVDRTERSGLGDTGYGMGAALGDYDNDGDLDLYVTNYGRDALYRNEGDGSFSEVTAGARLTEERWSTSACFFDPDRDGDLDLYVVTYVHHDPPKVCTDPAGRPEYCGPIAFRGTPDLFYRNKGDGTFREERSAGGLGERPNKGLGLVCVDLDGDGFEDVYVANDGEPNTLWVNRGGADGGIRFEDQSVVLGAAANFLGKPEASMGIGLGDVDGDLQPDIFLAHLNRETNTLYLNLGSSGFQDATAEWDLGRASLPYTGFGAGFLDAENDGDLDLLIVNGRVRRGEDTTELRGTPAEDAAVPSYWRHYAEPNLFFVNDGGARFRDASAIAGELTSQVEVSRGLMFGDLDRDGDLDVLVTNCNGPAHLFRNEAPRKGHHLTLRAYDPALGRDALGARLYASAQGRTQLRLVTSTYSYLVSVEPEAHFGLGAAERLDRLTVQWPDGERQRFAGLPVDRRITVSRRREGLP